jgi:hypothetical protein
MLDTIISAHAYERTGTEKPAPISMGPSFFHDAEGQDNEGNELTHSESESNESTRDEQEDEDSDSSRSSISEGSYVSQNSTDAEESNDSE